MSIGSFLRRTFGREPAAIPDELWSRAMAEHPIFGGIAEPDEARLRELTARFLARKQFDPVQGAGLTPGIRLSIAAQACLPILNLGFDWYRGWWTLIITPDAYTFESSEVDEAGVVHESEEDAGGEIMPLGSIVLSLTDVEDSGRCDGYNVVIHEMAHALDRRDGAMDGAPPLHRDMDPARWADVFTRAYDDLQRRVGRRREARNLRIDPYAAEAPEEFFAVTSEHFFEQPRLLRKEYPEVYDQLAAFYRQDPAERLVPPRVRRRRRS